MLTVELDADVIADGGKALLLDVVFYFTARLFLGKHGESDIESIKIAITRDSYFVMVTDNEQHKCHSDTKVHEISKRSETI